LHWISKGVGGGVQRGYDMCLENIFILFFWKWFFFF
jgi:hypothetical protein